MTDQVSGPDSATNLINAALGKSTGLTSEKTISNLQTDISNGSDQVAGAGNELIEAFDGKSE